MIPFRKITGVLCLCAALLWLGVPFCFPSAERIREDVKGFSKGEPDGFLHIQSRRREQGNCQIFCVEMQNGEMHYYRLRYRFSRDSGWDCVQALELLEG